MRLSTFKINDGATETIGALINNCYVDLHALTVLREQLLELIHRDVEAQIANEYLGADPLPLPCIPGCRRGQATPSQRGRFPILSRRRTLRAPSGAKASTGAG